MNEEKNGVQTGEEGPPSQTSTFRRVIALGAVAVLLIIGVAVIPMFLAGRQAEINKETQASNASYSAAAELKLKIPSRALSDAELQTLTPESELLKDAEVEFEIPFAVGGERAVIFFTSADVSVVADSGKLEKNALSDGILTVWTAEGTSGGKLSVSEGAKNYVITLEKGEDEVFKAVVSAVADE